MEQTKIKRQRVTTFIVIALILVGEMIFFRNILFNDSLFGAAYDGKLNNYFVEHWYKVFCGKEYWMDVLCFYPEKNVLSYSDIMLGMALPYSLLRALGMNMFAAFKLVLIATHIAGSYALYFFMHKCVKVSPWASLVAVAAFSFSNGYNIMMPNPQMIALSWVPFILIMIYMYYRNKNNKVRHVYGLATIGLIVLLFYTAFYVAYFVGIFMILALLLFVLCSILLRRNKYLRAAYQGFLGQWKDYIIYGILAIVFMIPFIQLYLPMLQNVGGRNWEDVLYFSPDWRSLCQLNDISNTMWDTTIYNLKSGFPLIDLCLFTIVAVVAIGLSMRNKKTEEHQFQTFMYLYLFLLVWFGLILVVKVHGHSIWQIIFEIVPGASALRGISRWHGFMTLWFGVIFAIFLDGIRIKEKKLPAAVCAILAVLLFCTNYAPQGVATEWNIAEEEAFLDSVDAPPKDCTVMYLTDREGLAEESNQMFLTSILQMKAWGIADKYDLRTVNGYSGHEPEGWNIQPQDPDVDHQVRDWLNQNHITEDVVYAYDIGTGKWTKLDY